MAIRKVILMFETIELQPVLERAWLSGFSTKSDFTRSEADPISVAACRGLITTQVGPSLFDRFWRITPKGLRLLWKLKEIG